MARGHGERSSRGSNLRAAEDSEVVCVSLPGNISRPGWPPATGIAEREAASEGEAAARGVLEQMREMDGEGQAGGVACGGAGGPYGKGAGGFRCLCLHCCQWVTGCKHLCKLADYPTI